MFKLEKIIDEFTGDVTLMLINNLVHDSNGWLFDLMYMYESGTIQGVLCINIKNKFDENFRFNPYDSIDIKVEDEIYSLKNALMFDKNNTPVNKYDKNSAMYPIKLQILEILYSGKPIVVRVHTKDIYSSFTLQKENKYALAAFHNEYKDLLLFC